MTTLLRLVKMLQIPSMTLQLLSTTSSLPDGCSRSNATRPGLAQQSTYPRDIGFLGHAVRDMRTLTISLRDSSLLRRIILAYYRALDFSLNIRLCPYRPNKHIFFGRFHGGVFNGDSGDDAEFLNLLNGELDSLDVGACA